MKQSQRLLHISQQARDIRIAYQSGEITHEERMERLNALVAGPSIWQRIASLFRKGETT